MLEVNFVQDLRADKLRQIDAAAQASYSRMLGDESRDNVATRNVLQGEYVIANGSLYVAMRNIPRGATLIEGVNVSETSVGEQLNALQKGE